MAAPSATRKSDFRSILLGSTETWTEATRRGAPQRRGAFSFDSENHSYYRNRALPQAAGGLELTGLGRGTRSARRLLTVAIGLSVGLANCSSSSGQSGAGSSGVGPVVAAESSWGSIASQLGGNKVTV